MENNRTTMKFTQTQLEQAFIQFLKEIRTHLFGGKIRNNRNFPKKKCQIFISL
jgi:hypothetical protein